MHPHATRDFGAGRAGEKSRVGPPARAASGRSGGSDARRGLPIIEPELPGTSTVERVGEAFSRGQFCLEAGKDAEAITAFQETVKIDPGFTEAWQYLAILYAKVGQEKKSLDAYHRAKKVAQH